MADQRDIQMNFTANTSQAEQAISRLKTETDKAGQSLDKQKTSTVNAGGAVISFGRIIQDAPFGIIGVANNITMLSEQFVSLKAQAGSTGAALTAMKASMMGPMGLSIAISVVTTALTMLALSSQKSKNAVKSTFDQLKQSLQESKNAMLDSMKAEGAKSVVTNALTAVLKDNKTSLDQRKNALAEIQKIHPDYLKGVNLETISQNDLNAKIEKGNLLIARRAEVMAYEAKLRKLYEQKMDVQEKVYATQPSLADVNKAKKKMGYGAIGGLTPDAGVTMPDQNETLIMANARLEMIARLEKKLLGPIDSAITQTSNILTELTKNMPTVKPDVITDPDDGDAGKTKKAIKEKVEATRSYFDMMKEEIKLTLEIDNLLGRKTGNNVYTSYLEIIGQEIQSGKLSQSELLEWLRLRKEVLSEMEEDQGEKWSSFKSFENLRGIIGSNIKGMKSQEKEDIKNKLKADQAAAKKQYEIYKDFFIDPFTETFKGEFSKAWNSIFGEANSLLEKFIQSLGESLFNKAVGSAASGILGMIFPGFNLLEAAVGGFGGGDRSTVNQIIIDGELIATQKQATRIKAQLDRQAALR